jgi:hypothetical protein
MIVKYSKRGKIEMINTATLPTRKLYEDYLKDFKSRGVSMIVECKERERRYPSRGDTSTERISSIYISGDMVREQIICSYGKNERNGADYCWHSKLYDGASEETQTADILYNKSYEPCQLSASFRASLENSASWYNIRWYYSWQNSPIIYAKTNSCPVGLSASGESLGEAHHLNASHKFVHNLSMALTKLEYVPEELLSKLQNIITSKQDFEKNQPAYLDFYKYLLGNRVGKYL